jgi:hypothetical protein
MKDFLPLIVGSLSAVTLVLVAFVGAWLGRKGEHARWLREERLAVYSEWLGALLETLIRIKRQYVLLREVPSSLPESTVRHDRGEDVGPGDLAERLRDQREHGFRLELERDVLYYRLQLLASPAVRAGAADLYVAATVALDSENPVAAREWVSGVVAFESLVRAELGLK